MKAVLNLVAGLAILASVAYSQAEIQDKRPTATAPVEQCSRFVIVAGAVRSPGARPWVHGMTLSMAIKRAGGTDGWNSGRNIKVTREGKTQLFNLNREAKDPSQNPKLLPGDEVEVP